MLVWLTRAGLVAALCVLGMTAWPNATPKSGTVNVAGMAVHAGEYPWREGMTVRQLMAEAGGPGKFASKRVYVYDANPAWHLRVMRRARGWMAGQVNSASASLGSAWMSWDLPGSPPALKISRSEPSLKGIVNLRVPSEDMKLSPGDTLAVYEKILSGGEVIIPLPLPRA